MVIAQKLLSGSCQNKRSCNKKIYTHTFSAERKNVDDIKDGFFEEMVQKNK